MTKKKTEIVIILLLLFFPMFFVSAGTILSSYKYAWSNNKGYINFANVVVNDSYLSGYAWSENAGWIKFNPANGGVLNDGEGNLSGYAWGESLGWIDFSNVSISTTTGKFSGTASGTLVGTINFDCPNYCDVRTDWASTPVVTSETPPNTEGTQIGSQSSGNNHVDSYNNSLVILPTQSGSIYANTSLGLVIIDVPSKALSKKTTFIFSEEKVDSINETLIPIKTDLLNSIFYNIVAIDQDGNYVHSFPHPIKITLPLPVNLVGVKNLGVYWLNETNRQWVLIPEAIFSNGSVTFEVDHLTKFAIFRNKEVDIFNKIQKPEPSLSLPSESELLEKQKTELSTSTNTTISEKRGGYIPFIVILIILVLFLIFVKYRRKSKV